ncbi:MAG: tripartite tricarboxylate transporter TctB family protein [Bauldia sp.]
MTIKRSELLCGAVFIAIGLAFGLDAWFELRIGTAVRMGPGYFPLVLAALLVLLGAGIVFAGVELGPVRGSQGTAAQPHPLPTRGLVAILASPVVFGITVEGLGLVPAIALTALCAAFGSRQVGGKLAAIMTVLLTLFCYLVFSAGLKLPARLFGPWLGPVSTFFGLS